MCIKKEKGRASMKRTMIIATLALLPITFVAASQWTELLSENMNRISKTVDDLTKKEIKEARKELRTLRKSSDRILKERAKKGNPLAGLALAHKNSKESISLSRIPALANSAAEDAVRWYNLAAKMGARNSISINGLSVPPVRATRK